MAETHSNPFAAPRVPTIEQPDTSVGVTGRHVRETPHSFRWGAVMAMVCWTVGVFLLVVAGMWAYLVVLALLGIEGDFESVRLGICFVTGFVGGALMYFWAGQRWFARRWATALLLSIASLIIIPVLWIVALVVSVLIML